MNTRARRGWPLRDRLLAFVDKAEDGCWNWTGFIAPQGYGRFTVRGHSTHEAHRHSYMLFVGPIPEGLVIDHKCCNRRCVNPDHLQAVTVGENNNLAAERRTHCKRGHPLTPDNLYLMPERRPALLGIVRRCCRECNRIATVRKRLRQGRYANPERLESRLFSRINANNWPANHPTENDR